MFLRYIFNKKAIKPVKFEDINRINVTGIDIEFIREITLSEIYDYLDYMTKYRKINANTRGRRVACIKSLFRYLHKKARLVNEDPAIDLEKPKTVKRLPKYLKLDESENLLDAISGKYEIRDYAMITLFLNCGLRLSELTGINLSKIKNNILTVIGKGNKERVIHLNEACIDAVNKYIQVRPTDGKIDKDALFLSERKTRISNKMVQYTVKKFIGNSGLDREVYSTHKLRHTAATLMFKHGNVDIRTLQKILGHESIATTEIYTHVDDKQMKDAINKNPLGNIRREQATK